MVRKARESKQDSNQIAQPDLDRMRSIFIRDLKPAEEKSAKTRGDQSAAWKTIEKDCNCNKRAAKALFSLHGMSDELRDDFLRTFLPGLKALNLVPAADLAGDGLEDVVDELSAGIVAGAKKPMGTEGMPGLQ